ncbi:MAG: hypothetical protein ACOZQL_22915 [Myxococcota bacterium]
MGLSTFFEELTTREQPDVASCDELDGGDHAPKVAPQLALLLLGSSRSSRCYEFTATSARGGPLAHTDAVLLVARHRRPGSARNAASCSALASRLHG